MPGANSTLAKGQSLLATPGAPCTMAATQRTSFPSFDSLKFCCIPACASAWSFSPRTLPQLPDRKALLWGELAGTKESQRHSWRKGTVRHRRRAPSKTLSLAAEEDVPGSCRAAAVRACLAASRHTKALLSLRERPADDGEPNQCPSEESVSPAALAGGAGTGSCFCIQPHLGALPGRQLLLQEGPSPCGSCGVVVVVVVVVA